MTSSEHAPEQGTVQPAGRVASPCTGVCRIPAGQPWCEGCWRSLDEIAAWSSMSDAQRRSVWRLLPARRPSAAAGTPA